jgi:hypothetical protein
MRKIIAADFNDNKKNASQCKKKVVLVELAPMFSLDSADLQLLGVTH